MLQSLSDLIFVTRGNRMDTPPAVCVVELVNSAPVISHTGAVEREIGREEVKDGKEGKERRREEGGKEGRKGARGRGNI